MSTTKASLLESLLAASLLAWSLMAGLVTFEEPKKARSSASNRPSPLGRFESKDCNKILNGYFKKLG